MATVGGYPGCMRWARATVLVLALATACSDDPTASSDAAGDAVVPSTDEVPTTEGAAPTQPADPEVVLAAGDIAGCDTSGDELTAELLLAQPQATVLTLGDNVYAAGSA